MATRIQREPAQLLAAVREDYWPGDEEVDLDGSDLVQWCREGGRSGLVLKNEQEAAVIRWKPLSPRELEAVRASSTSDGLAVFDAAFAVGFQSARNIEGVQVHRTSATGIPRLTPDSVRSFEAVEAELPIVAAYDRYNALYMGEDAYLDYVKNSTILQSDGKTDAEILADYQQGLGVPIPGITLPRAVGVHIMIASFRARSTPR